MGAIKNLSEHLFESFSIEAGITFCPVERDLKQTPDYDLFVQGIQIVVEVKQIDPNDDNIQAEQDFVNNPDKVVLVSSRPGKRVYYEVNKAARQIANRARGRHPAMLVLYNNVRLVNYLDGYSAKTGLFGIEKIILEIPKDFSTPQVQERGFGPKRKLTTDQNTSISAVAVLHASAGQPSELLVYHNPFAALPLDPALLSFPSVRQFKLREKRYQQFQEWEPVET